MTDQVQRRGARHRLGIVLSATGGAVLAALLAGCQQPRDALPVLTDVPYQASDWEFARHAGRRMLTEHYDIRTTVRDPLLIESIPQAVETAYGYYRQLVPTEREPSERMRVYLFARRDEWAAFTRRFAGARAATLLKVRRGGYSERGVSVIQYVAHSVTFPLLTHEGFHQYLYCCVKGRVPAWLNEGLATLCEGQRWSGSGLQSFDPWYNPTRRNALADALVRGDLIPLDELLEMNAGHVVGGPTRKIGTYYAQVWALMLFLREGADGAYAESFDRLLHALGREDLRPHARAAYVKTKNPVNYSFGRGVFEAFIGTDLQAIEREYVAFVRARLLGSRKKDLLELIQGAPNRETTDGRGPAIVYHVR